MKLKFKLYYILFIIITFALISKIKFSFLFGTALQNWFLLSMSFYYIVPKGTIKYYCRQKKYIYNKIIYEILHDL